MSDVSKLSRKNLEAELVKLREESEHARDSGDRVASDGWRTTPATPEMLFAAVEKTRMPMIITDPNVEDNPIVFANRAFQELSGYEAQELLGRNCRFLQGDDTDPEQVAQIRRLGRM